MTYQEEIEIQTTGHRRMHDLTQEVARIVKASSARTGLVNIFNVGSTAAVGTIEFEPGFFSWVSLEAQQLARVKEWPFSGGVLRVAAAGDGRAPVAGSVRPPGRAGGD